MAKQTDFLWEGSLQANIDKGTLPYPCREADILLGLEEVEILFLLGLEEV